MRKKVEERNARKLSLFNRIALWLNYVAIIFLFLSVIAKYISPRVFWPLAFFGLGFPLFYAVNLFFLLYWLVQLKKQLIFSLIALVFSTQTLSLFVAWNKEEKTNQGKTLKITSFNCMLFDLYNWKNNKQSRSRIFEEMAETNSDIYCFQEYYTSEEPGDFNNNDTLPDVLNTSYLHYDYTTTLREYDHWGIATFSKYPIINKGKIVFKTRNNNICIYSDIVKNNDTFRVYNIHLQSISFSKADNQYLEEIKQGVDSENDVEKSKSILRRLKRAFIKRAQQTEAIKEHIKNCPYPFIICGDFNDTPSSYTYKQLSTGICDAFLEKGNGFGKTYAGEWPKFRIDYILYSNPFSCVKFIRHPDTFTDHHPITANLILRNDSL